MKIEIEEEITGPWVYASIRGVRVGHCSLTTGAWSGRPNIPMTREERRALGRWKNRMFEVFQITKRLKG